VMNNIPPDRKNLPHHRSWKSKCAVLLHLGCIFDVQ